MRIRSLFHRKSSRQVAKDRLKILLISDRAGCSPEMLEMIKKDIAEVISRYMRIDTDQYGDSDQQIRAPWERKESHAVCGYPDSGSPESPIAL